MIDRQILRSLLVEAAAEGAKIALAAQEAKARPKHELERMLSMSEAGQVLHVSQRTMRAWCSSGRLASRLVGRRRLIAESAIRALLETDEEALRDADVRAVIAAERRRPLGPPAR